jgi:hypothetical protein
LSGDAPPLRALLSPPAARSRFRLPQCRHAKAASAVKPALSQSASVLLVKRRDLAGRGQKAARSIRLPPSFAPTCCRGFPLRAVSSTSALFLSTLLCDPPNIALRGAPAAGLVRLPAAPPTPMSTRSPLLRDGTCCRLSARKHQGAGDLSGSLYPPWGQSGLCTPSPCPLASACTAHLVAPPMHASRRACHAHGLCLTTAPSAAPSWVVSASPLHICAHPGLIFSAPPRSGFCPRLNAHHAHRYLRARKQAKRSPPASRERGRMSAARCPDHRLVRVSHPLSVPAAARAPRSAPSGPVPTQTCAIGQWASRPRSLPSSPNRRPAAVGVDVGGAIPAYALLRPRRLPARAPAYPSCPPRIAHGGPASHACQPSTSRLLPASGPAAPATSLRPQRPPAQLLTTRLSPYAWQSPSWRLRHKRSRFCVFTRACSPPPTVLFRHPAPQRARPS